MAFDPTKPARTKGQDLPVRIISTDGKSDQPIAGWVLWPDGSETVEQWGSDGRYNPRVPIASLDLENIPTKREGWVNLYRRHIDGVTVTREAGIFPHKGIAQDHGDMGDGTRFTWIAAVPVVWEE